MAIASMDLTIILLDESLVGTMICRFEPELLSLRFFSSCSRGTIIVNYENMHVSEFSANLIFSWMVCVHGHFEHIIT